MLNITYTLLLRNRLRVLRKRPGRSLRQVQVRKHAEADSATAHRKVSTTEEKLPKKKYKNAIIL